MEDRNQVSSEERGVEEADSEDTKGTQNEEESKESLEKSSVKNSNSDEHRVEDESEERKSDSEALATNLQELENAHIQFARSTKEAIISESLKKELDDIKDRIGDMKNGVIAGEAKKESRCCEAFQVYNTKDTLA